MKLELDGQAVFVGTGGSPWQADQPTLVLQHGAGMDRTVWVLLARYFARHGYNVVCPDLPAHGASGGAVLQTIEAQADFLWQLLDTLQRSQGLPDGPVILGGHSMGSLVAIEAAGRQPARVRQLLLLGTGYPMPVAQPLLEAAADNSQAAVDMIAIFSHSLASQLGHNPVAGISVQQSAMALLERAAPGVLHADLKACNDYAGLESAIAGMGSQRPAVTMILGAEDRMTPIKASRGVAERLGAQVTVIDDCGHMMMSEQPEATLQAMKRVLMNG